MSKVIKKLTFQSIIVQKQSSGVFYKKGVSWKFRKIQRKTSVPEPQGCNFIKKESLAQVFSVNFAKFPRTPFLIEHLRWLLLIVICKWYLLAGIGYKEVRKVKTQQLCFVNNSVLKPLVLHMKKYIYKKPLHTTRFVKTKHKNETLLMN